MKNIDFVLVANQSLLNLPTIFASQMMFECFRMMVFCDDIYSMSKKKNLEKTHMILDQLNH